MKTSRQITRVKSMAARIWIIYQIYFPIQFQPRLYKQCQHHTPYSHPAIIIILQVVKCPRGTRYLRQNSKYKVTKLHSYTENMSRKVTRLLFSSRSRAKKMDVVNQKATTIRGLELLEMHSYLKLGATQIQMNDKVDLTDLVGRMKYKSYWLSISSFVLSSRKLERSESIFLGIKWTLWRISS